MTVKKGVIALSAFILAAVLGFVAGCTPAIEASRSSDDRATAAGKTSDSAEQNKSGQKNNAENDRAKEAAEIIENMSLEDKVAQIFVVTPEVASNFSGTVTASGEASREAYGKRPVGGIMYSTANLIDPEQTRDMLHNMQKISVDRTGLPALLCVDEEGGSVARVSSQGVMGVPEYPDMREIGAEGDIARAEEIGSEMGEYLSDLGFNVNFAPVADVLTNPQNTVVRDRSFGADPQLVADMDSAFMKGLQKHSVVAVYKHFPGHGSTAEDSHLGAAIAQSDAAAFDAVDLLPFKQGIADGVTIIMVGHMAFPSVSGENTPATLSSWAMTTVAREQLGFKGILMTDSMGMGAVTNLYDSAQAAVISFQAGADMILTPADSDAAYEGVLAAVRSGSISEQRLDESLMRIVTLKLELRDKQAG